MTKEEIKNADLKDLGLRYIELLFQERIDLTESYNYFFEYISRLISFKEYRRLCKKFNKNSFQCWKECCLILKLRPSVKSYIKYILEKIKANNIIPTPYPGIYIKEYIFENQIYPEDLADDLGITKTELFFILEGRSKITEELALKLSEVIGTSAEVWLNLQKSYDQQNKLVNNKTICLTKITLEDLLYSNLIPIRTCIYINLDNESVYCGESDLTLICNSISDIKYLKMKIKSISTCLLCDTPCIYIDLNCETGGDSK